MQQLSERYVESQREEVIRALSGHGMYRLCPELPHYGVSSQVWMKMRAEQRRDIVTTFEKARLPKSPPSQSSNSVSDDTVLSTEATVLKIQELCASHWLLCNVGQGFTTAIKRKWNNSSTR